jgi:hypothetical protein
MNATCKQVPLFLTIIEKPNIDYKGPQYSDNIKLPEQLRFLNKFPSTINDDDIAQVCQQNDMFCKEKGGQYCTDCGDIIKLTKANLKSETDIVVNAYDNICKLQYDNSIQENNIAAKITEKTTTILNNANSIKDTNTTINDQLDVLQKNTDKINYINQQLSANSGQMDQDNKKKFIGFVYANLGIEMTNKSYFYSLLTIDVTLAILFLYLLFKKAN